MEVVLAADKKLHNDAGAQIGGNQRQHTSYRPIMQQIDSSRQKPLAASRVSLSTEPQHSPA